MSASGASKFVNTILWPAAIAGFAGALYIRMTGDYGADSPMGVAWGIGSYVLIVAAVVSGWLRRGPSPIARVARQVHYPLAMLALGAALAHWHLRLRDFLGLATALLFILVFLSSSLGVTRRYRVLRWVHKYAGYALLLLGPLHGIRALLFSGN